MPQKKHVMRSLHVQAAELRDLDNPSDIRNLPNNRTLLFQPQVCPRSVVVDEIGSKRSPAMSGIEDHEMVQAISSYAADQAFGVWILPGALRCREHLFNL